MVSRPDIALGIFLNNFDDWLLFLFFFLNIDEIEILFNLEHMPARIDLSINVNIIRLPLL